jgi:AcrR family transcriptional regulator
VTPPPPTGPPAPTRDRILDATADLFRRHGYTGTGMKQVVTAAQAPFGSLYHHFPGGKEELGVEVIGRSGEMYRQLFDMILGGAPDYVTGVGDFFHGAAELLRATDYEDACPIATVALEIASTSEPMREACDVVVESWIATGVEHAGRAGIPDEPARALTIRLICLLEGAFLLCRVAKRTEAMEVCAASAVADARAVLADVGA